MRIIRRILITLLILIILLFLGVLLIWYGTKLEPTFYKNLAINNPERAKLNSDAMKRKINELLRDLQKPTEHEWMLEFTEYELNHWLELDLKKNHPGALSSRVSDPRGEIREEFISCGAHVDARWQGYEYDGVVSVDFLPIIESPNVFRFKILTVRAGVVPLPKTYVLQLLTKLAGDLAVKVEWLREDGYHILRVPLEPGMLRSSDGRDITVKKIELGHGKMLIRGTIAAK